MNIFDEELKYRLEELKQEMQQIETIINEKQRQQKQFENYVIADAEEKEILNFQDSWLTLENYQLKILVITSILAENNFAFRGKLDTICEWLGVKTNSYNKNKIIDAINELQRQELIFYKQDKKVYTITISEKARNTQQVSKILKDWIIVFKNYNKDENGKIIDENSSVDWVNILKVFVFFYQNIEANFTQKELAERLNIKSERAISRAIKAIKKCNIERIDFESKLIKVKYRGEWRTRGTKASMNYAFEDKQNK